MVRSFWMGPPAVALALAAAAWGQAPVSPYAAPVGSGQASTSPYGASAAPAPAATPVPAAPGERVITVQEMGRSGQRARVVRSWQQPDGAQVYQVQSLETGEMLTIVESGPLVMPTAPGRPPARAVATRIFHWGRSSRPPAGSPLPPSAPVVETITEAPLGAEGVELPVAERMESGDTHVEMKTPPATRVTARVEAKPSLLSKLLPGRQTAQPVQPVAHRTAAEPATAEEDTQVGQPTRPSPGTHSAASSDAVAKEESPEAGKAPERKAQPRRTTHYVTDGKPSLWQRLFGNEKPRPGMPHRPAKIAVASERKKDAGPKLEKVDVAAEPAGPSDWRKSWGQVERTDATPGEKGTDVARTREDLPHTRKGRAGDPLSDPSAYRKRGPAGDADAGPSLAQGPERPVVLPPPPLRGTGLPVPPGVPAPKGEVPPGSGSVVAAGDPHYLPVPMVTVPPTRPTGPPPAEVPEAPAPNRMVSGAYQAGAAGSGMGNAFTVAGPSRPIPSETKPADQMVNAFTSQETGAPPAPYPAAPAPAPAYPVPTGYAALPAMPEQPGVPGVARIPVMPAQFTPANYYGPAAPGLMGAMPGAMAAPAAPPTTAQVLQMLRDSDYPSQREWAAEQLAEQNWRTQPQAVQALLSAARGDPAPMVRACCVRSLVRMQVNTVPVVATIQELKRDADPRVRDAVGEALTAFGVEPAATGAAPIQPVGAPDSRGQR